MQNAFSFRSPKETINDYIYYILGWNVNKHQVVYTFVILGSYQGLTLNAELSNKAYIHQSN